MHMQQERKKSTISPSLSFNAIKERGMNEKAYVSKELNDKLAKVLQGLMKLPENKECADCRSKAPRWASINLGIFICMRCSGIHRSLGVHISKVRSTTLDTWLPEQVAFMQLMGNQRSNSYFEADLPPTFQRNQMEQFIYAKYVDKRWASTTAPQPQAELIRIAAAAAAEKSSSSSSSSGSCSSGGVNVVRKEIPKRARKYSLDENFFNKEIFAPHSRSFSTAKSFHMTNDEVDDAMNMNMNIGSSSFNANANGGATATATATAAVNDLFSLLYVSEDRTVVPPSRWATFD